MKNGRARSISWMAAAVLLIPALTRVSSGLGLVLAGRKDAARAQAAPAKEGEIAAFPAVRLTGLDGRTLTRKDLAGRVVLVEFWATWCLPCSSTCQALFGRALSGGQGLSFSPGA